MSGFFRGREQRAVVPAPTRATTPPARSEVVDARLAACPYCGIELKKVPSAATKCPDCHKTMYVRTDHRIQKRLVVTDEQADEIDDGNEALGMGDLATYERRRRETYERLEKKFGQPPSVNDVRWGMCNEDLLLYQSRRDYGLYRNTRYKMMEILQRRGNEKEALRYALEIFYIDSCDPSNMNGLVDEPRFDIRAWDASAPLRRGSLTDWLRALCENIGISVEQAARDYESDANHLREFLKMPRAWSSTWPKCI